MTRSVLITGATGFVGSALAERCLQRGDHVTVLLADYNRHSRLIRDNLITHVDVQPGRLDDIEHLTRILETAQVDTIYHLAAVAQEQAALAAPWEMFEANVRGTYTLLDAARRTGGQVQRIVMASSDKAYGQVPPESLPYVESMPMAGTNPYDVSKSSADLIARSYWHAYGLPVAVGRYANIFGPGDGNTSRLIPGSIHRLLRGQPPVIRHPESGEFRRDFLFIGDAAESYLAMADGLDHGVAQGEGFNFAMGVSFSPREIVAEVQRLMRAEHIEVHEEAMLPGEITQQHVAIEKAGVVLGWKPATSLVDGLDRAIQWYRAAHQSQAA